eukprot:COSAG06_NODE_12797_length_1327_cov_1.505700_2_plen_168_part_00
MHTGWRHPHQRAHDQFLTYLVKLRLMLTVLDRRQSPPGPEHQRRSRDRGALELGRRDRPPRLPPTGRWVGLQPSCRLVQVIRRSRRISCHIYSCICASSCLISQTFQLRIHLRFQLLRSRCSSLQRLNFFFAPIVEPPICVGILIIYITWMQKGSSREMKRCIQLTT